MSPKAPRGLRVWGSVRTQGGTLNHRTPPHKKKNKCRIPLMRRTPRRYPPLPPPSPIPQLGIPEVLPLGLPWGVRV